MNQAVFFDRDGVLNHAVIKQGKPYPPANIDELIIAADAKAALLKLKAAGFLLIGATNQPDVARGTTARSTVEEINHCLIQELGLDAIYACYHDDKDDCHCRKPLPGLLHDAAEKHQINLSKSFMIGDRWKDIAAGQAAFCKTIWLQADYTERQPTNPNFITHSLADAAEWILAE